MAGRLEAISNFFRGGVASTKVPPTKTVGSPGYAVHGGYIQTKERNSAVYGSERWRTYSDLLVNTSIIAAGVRSYLNLIARTEWTVEAAKDIDGEDSSDAAEEAAEWVSKVIHGMETPWGKVIQRAASYTFFGFSTNEWTAIKLDDGTIGLKNVLPLPQHTIERWDIDEAGRVLGIVQRAPQTGREIYIPRSKLLYLVDDVLTDMPDGTGLMRHVVEPGKRLQEYLRNEGMGFERDLRGIPLGRAPYKDMANKVAKGEMTAADMTSALGGLEDIVALQAKSTSTGLILDSDVYTSVSDTGTSPSQVYKWGIELLKGDPQGLEQIGAAVDRLNREIARVLGVEHLMLGDGAGSRALSEDKTRNFHLQIEGLLADIADAAEKDLLGPLWALNGFDEALKPCLKYEAVQFKDVAKITAALRDLAASGAMMLADDPAINDVRQMLGISEMPEPDPELKDAEREAQLAGFNQAVLAAEAGPIPEDTGEKDERDKPVNET